MHNQIQQQHTAPVNDLHTQHTQQGQYNHDARPAYAASYSNSTTGNHHDGQSSVLSSLMGGLNLQGQRGPSKYGGLKGNVPVAIAPNVDMHGVRRSPYNGQVVLLSNGSMFNGVSPVPQFTTASVQGQDQVGQIPCLPTNLYSGFNPGCSVVPGSMQGYSYPYLLNCNMQDFYAAQRKGPWVSNENYKGPGSVAAGSGNSSEFTPSSHSGHASSLSGYAARGGQLSNPCLPLQMMKTPSGYILQDLEILTQQDPAIPRAVPAMWTNQTELTLAKCLENREGITNVYIRGFLPETTDDLLHSYASRFGKVERCKAIVDLDSGMCKGCVPVTRFH